MPESQTERDALDRLESLFAAALQKPAAERGPQRDGISKETGLLKEWPKGGPKLLWQVNDVGYAYSTPAVVGDRLYGADPVLAAHLGLTRQWLHAVRLGFAHPVDGRPMVFTSDYPPDLRHALEVLRAES